MAKYYYRKPKPKKIGTTILKLIMAFYVLGFLGLSGDVAVAVLFLGTAGYLGYRATTLYQNKQKALTKQATNLKLEDLKEHIKRVDRQVKLLETYADDKAWTQYGVLAQQILPQITDIKQEAYHLQEYIEPAIYSRITRKATTVTDEIKQQLVLLNLPEEPVEMDDTEERILKIAPEIIKTYRSIQIDHQTILEKIKNSDNQAELQALHDTNMKRFEDILTGYLKIKETPKNFHNAEERLELARQALEQFDLELDQSLRELNESDLADFEVSLRMMTKISHDPLQDSTLD